jgi:hypothetical protein
VSRHSLGESISDPPCQAESILVQRSRYAIPTLVSSDCFPFAGIYANCIAFLTSTLSFMPILDRLYIRILHSRHRRYPDNNQRRRSSSSRLPYSRVSPTHSQFSTLLARHRHVAWHGLCQFFSTCAAIGGRTRTDLLSIASHRLASKL